MKAALKVLGVMALLVVVGGGGFFFWAKSAVADKLAQDVEVHQVDFPIPYPLSEAELAALRQAKAPEAQPDAEVEAPAGAAADGEAPAEAPAAAESGAPTELPSEPLEGMDLEKLALERAVARGKHLVEARYACIECHGKDFGGGVMVDDPAIGKLLGPNITSGQGGKTADYTATDWDRIVRHGVKPDGHPAAMPAEDFQLMSDQELSDIITFLRSVPPVDKEVDGVSLGPLGTVLMATGKLPLAVDLIHDHNAKHATVPPSTEVNATFGKHLAGICTGCHRSGLQGGPIAAGPPDWAPARNLTPHADGLKGWSYEDFAKAMREGLRPDGSTLKAPMALMLPYALKMTDTEMQALWAYISTVDAQATGQ